MLHCLSADNSELAGIHVGLDALADQPVAKLRKQLEVNLVAQLIVTKVSWIFKAPRFLALRLPMGSQRTGMPECHDYALLKMHSCTLADWQMQPAMWVPQSRRSP